MKGFELGKVDGVTQAYKECDRCREALRIVLTKDAVVVATDQRSGYKHICFDIPEDANLLVLGDQACIVGTASIRER